MDHHIDDSFANRLILSQLMKYALNDGLINKNPCADMDIEIPSDKISYREALDIEDYKDILQNKSKLRFEDNLLLSIAMYTGMRRGEILGLRTEDIDKENYVINVRRNVTHPNQNQPIISTTKTKAGERTIPIDDELLEMLNQINHEGYIFGEDKPITLKTFTNMWNRIKKTINMHGATLHTLRHSYITYAVGTTSDYKTIQGISGHADINILLNRYAHPQKEKVHDLCNSMHTLLG